MHRGSRGFAVALLTGSAAAILATPAHAQLGDVFVHGFVSQGYFNTSGNEYLIDESEEGSAEFNEAALVFYSLPTDRLRIAAQLFARDFGNIGNNAVVFDWAFGDYQWRDELGIRVGKIRLPWGLYNGVRDVDAARDQIFLPQSVYNEDFRDFLLAYQGAGAYGHFDFENFGGLDYELWGGTFNVPDPTRGFWRELFESLGRVSEADVAEFLVGENVDVDVDVAYGGVLEPVVTFPWAYGGAVTWQTPIEGLRAGITGLRSEVESTAQLLYNVSVEDVATGELELFRTNLPVGIQLDVDVLATASAEYVRDRWTFAVEYEYEKIGSGAGSEGDGWYGLVSYALTDRVALTSYYSETYPDRYDRSGRSEDYPIRAMAWHKDFAIGARVDLTENWRVKFEHHSVDGLQLIDDAGLPEFDEDDFERKWSYFALKSTFHF